MNAYAQVGLTIVSGILIAAVTSWISVRLAIRQFYSQKWWERKADAYASIVEALYHVKHNLETEMSAEEFGAQLSAETKEEIKRKYKESFQQINRAEGMGAFIISKRSSEILTQLRRDRDEHDEMVQGPYYEILSTDFGDIDRALKALRDEAKRDLKIGGRTQIWSKLASVAASRSRNVRQ